MVGVILDQCFHYKCVQNTVFLWMVAVCFMFVFLLPPLPPLYRLPRFKDLLLRCKLRGEHRGPGCDSSVLAMTSWCLPANQTSSVTQRQVLALKCFCFGHVDWSLCLQLSDEQIVADTQQGVCCSHQFLLAPTSQRHSTWLSFTNTDQWIWSNPVPVLATVTLARRQTAVAPSMPRCQR